MYVITLPFNTPHKLENAQVLVLANEEATNPCVLLDH
jgi:hypothetical protein